MDSSNQKRGQSETQQSRDPPLKIEENEAQSHRAAYMLPNLDLEPTSDISSCIPGYYFSVSAALAKFTMESEVKDANRESVSHESSEEPPDSMSDNEHAELTDSEDDEFFDFSDEESDELRELNVKEEDSKGALRELNVKEEDSQDELSELNVRKVDSKGEAIGHCKGSLIKRDQIRWRFYEKMGAPSHNTRECAVTLFDRWGNLKPAFYTHAVKKGSGAWGKELNRGNFLFITSLSVQKGHRLNGFGSKMVKDLWTKACVLDPFCNFAIAWAHLPSSELPPEYQFLGDRGYQWISEGFWRAIGYRRIGNSSFFGFHPDEGHPSHTISAQDDYRTTSSLCRPPYENQVYPYTGAMIYAKDQNVLELLKQRLDATSHSDAIWLKTDHEGNNIMHFCAFRKPLSLGWLCEQPFAQDLSRMRNMHGETPLEWLEISLDRQRTITESCDALTDTSHSFQGYRAIDASCLALLYGRPDPLPLVLEQIRFGCSCGQCIMGFISPRMACVVAGHAAKWHNDSIEYISKGHRDGHDWVLRFCVPLHRLSIDVLSDMDADESMRWGLTTILACISSTLNSKKALTEINILESTNDEGLESCKSYLNNGGTVSAAVLGCFDLALEHDARRFLSTNQEEMQGLVECRNDHEYLFAQRQYCRELGLPIAI